MLRELSIRTGTTASVRPVCGEHEHGVEQEDAEQDQRGGAQDHQRRALPRRHVALAPAYVRYTSAAMATSPRAHAHQGIGNPNVMLLCLQYPLTPPRPRSPWISGGGGEWG